jgi:Putative MetA-pathway of phenol degradation
MLASFRASRSNALSRTAHGWRIFSGTASFYLVLLRVSALFALLDPTVTALAQELEPRTYSPSPVGTNFLVATYTYLTGDVLTDPSLPINNVQANINVFTLGYVRTLGIAGHAASIGLGIPFARGNISGNVFDAAREVHRSGLGDLRMRFAFGLLGNPALSPEEFAKHVPTTSLGASLTVIAPTGQYVPSRLINVGTNRWSFKPELGISQPFGKWFFEASAGAWFYTNNSRFLGNNTRGQDPLAVVQLHAGYTFRPSLWVSGDVGYYSGGRTNLNGVPNQDRQSNTRYGITFSAPLATGWSAKLTLAKGLITRAGGDYKSISLTLQYRWSD